MKAGELVRATVKVFGAEEQTVKVAMREFRWRDMLTTGARGVNAPDLTPLDVARVVAAFTVYERPGQRGPELLTALRHLEGNRIPEDDPPAFSLEALAGLEAPYTFEDALAALILVYAFHRDSEAYQSARREMIDGTIREPECVVEILQDSDVSARITLGGPREPIAIYDFQPIVPIRVAQERLKTAPARHSIHWIDQRAIIQIAEDFARTSEPAEESA